MYCVDELVELFCMSSLFNVQLFTINMCTKMCVVTAAAKTIINANLNTLINFGTSVTFLHNN